MNPLEIQGLVLDMDGVLWRGSRAMPGLRRLFGWLAEAELPYVLATNNSSRRPEAHRDKLAAFGLEVPIERVLSAAMVCAEQLGRSEPPGTSVFVIGEDGLHAALRSSGLRILNPLPGREVPTDGPTDVADRVDDRTGVDVPADSDERADIVVAGIDRDLDYDRLAQAALHIQRGARFVASNPDPSYPAEAGLLPGAGAIQAAVTAVTGVSPQVMGKPHAPIFESALERLGLPASAVAMVGDRLDTDVLGANRAGLRSVLLLSGVTRARDVEPEITRIGPDARPDLVVPGLPDLLAWLSAGV